MVSRLLNGCAKALHAVSAPGLTDEQRETALRPAAFGMLGQSILLAFVLAGVGVFYAGSSLTSERVFGKDLYSLTATLLIVLGSIAYLAVYRFLRQTPEPSVDEDPYSEIDKALHAVALDNPIVPRSLLRIQRLGRRTPGTLEHPVWVAGLARSGTTLITELLYESERFRCLTYRDMPFPLCPGIWMRLNAFGSRRAVERERAHHDGMLVSLNSSEALEEVFWRVYDPSYIQSDRLCRHDPERTQWNRYRGYLEAILRADPQRPRRYLAKNNNLATRYPAMLQAIPEATIVVPFRDPIRQSESLLRQHQLWCERHERDSFSRQYMSWLVHHEFGSDHRPYDLGQDLQVPRAERPNDRGKADQAGWLELTHWLEQWIEVYQHLLEHRNDRVHFLCYESLCEDPSETLNGLLSKLEVELPETDRQRHHARISSFKPPERQIVGSPLDPIHQKAIELYDQLCELAAGR